MARRSGQSGSIERKGNWWYVRYWLDIPGQDKRKHVCERLGPAVGKNKLKKNERQRLAKEAIERSGTNSAERFHEVEALSSSVTFRQQSEAWLRYVQQRKRKPIKPHTASTWESHLKWINQQIGERPLAAVNNAVVKELVAVMANSTKPDDPKQPRFSAKTISNYVQVVKMVVASAVDEQGEELYPRKWNHEFIDLPEVAGQKTPTFTAENISDILKRSNGQCYILYALLAGTGLRIGEALALEAPDVSPDGRTISVRQSLWNGVLQSPKTENGIREVDVDPELAELLRAFIGNRTTGFLFQSGNGRYLSDTNIRNRSLHPILKEAGITKTGFHSFRRFRITYLRKNRAPEDLLRFWIGHSNKSVTDRYSKLKEDREFRRDTAEEIGLGFEILLREHAQLSECPKSSNSTMSATQ